MIGGRILFFSLFGGEGFGARVRWGRVRLCVKTHSISSRSERTNGTVKTPTMLVVTLSMSAIAKLPPAASV